MKALFISNDPSILDTSSSTYARMRSYAEAIGTLHILMRSNERVDRPDGPLTVHGVPAGKLLGMNALVSRAKQIITTEGIEVVSAQDPFEYGMVALKATAGTNAKLHIQVHTDFLSPWFIRSGVLRSPKVSMPLKNRARQALADKVLPKAHGIRVVSERVKQSLMTRYGSRIPEPTVIPIAVGTEVPAAVPLPEHPFPFVLMTTGRLEPEKRIEDILEALHLIHDRYPAVGLMIVGEGREEEVLKKFVAAKGIADRVMFLGAQPDAWGLMRSAQGYIQASAYEGYGRTLIEAALARVPVITTDVGVVGEVFKGYEDVLATPPGDPTQLAVNIVALLEDTSARELMMRSAEQKARAHLMQFVDLPQLIASDLGRLAGGSS
jgi:glycosyltransferase involved in cell wall biosynthesis